MDSFGVLNFAVFIGKFKVNLNIWLVDKLMMF